MTGNWLTEAKPLLGIITERDMVKLARSGRNLATTKAGALITQQLITIRESSALLI